MTRSLSIHLLLAFVWVAIGGELTAESFMVGLLVGYAVLWVLEPLVGSTGYATRVRHFAILLAVFAWDLVLASLRVAYDVITPRHRMRPGVVAVPLDVRSDAEITILATLVTLTPGSVSLDVSRDRRFLYVHAMYLDPDDLDGFRRRLKARVERRVIRAFGPH